MAFLMTGYGSSDVFSSILEFRMLLSKVLPESSWGSRWRSGKTGSTLASGLRTFFGNCRKVLLNSNFWEISFGTLLSIWKNKSLFIALNESYQRHKWYLIWHPCCHQSDLDFRFRLPFWRLRKQIPGKLLSSRFHQLQYPHHLW